MLMEDSILQSTKKILGIDGSMDAFDADVLTCINSAFSVLSQLGIFEEAGVAVEDERLTWSDLELPVAWIQQIRTYVFLKTQFLFDPPTTGFLLTARNE